MISLLAFRNVAHRPWRSAFLVAGFGIGVGVMIVLLSVGEAMLVQARDEKLVGGGQVTVLPEGIDLEVMKTGGVGGLYFSIANARFVAQQLLASPRLGGDVTAVAPQVEGKTVWLRANGRELSVRATGEVPGATRAVGAGPALAAGAWDDNDTDRRWGHPTPAELRHEIDHFHVPPADRPRDERESWGEWHYVNVLYDGARRWAFLTFMVAGDVPAGRWGGQLLFTLHQQGGRARRFSLLVDRRGVRYALDRADLALGPAAMTVDSAGDYHVRGTARGEGADAGHSARVDLVLRPAPRAYFPGASLGGSGPGALVSGYAVPALRGEASGTICVDRDCTRLEAVQAYHDHNWGLWKQVNWEWGQARAGAFTFLYGRVQQTGAAAASVPMFFYLVDSLGFRALFRPAAVAYDDARTILVGGRRVRVPARATMADVRGGDTLRVTIEVDDAVGTDLRTVLVQRGDRRSAGAIAHPYFIQMKGRATIAGRVGGSPLAGTGHGFFETYR